MKYSLLRKILSLLLIILLSVSTLAGCGDSEPKKGSRRSKTEDDDDDWFDDDDDDDDDDWKTPTPSKPGKQTDTGKKFNIRQSENAKITYEKYDNGLFTAEIPKGWVVNVLELSDYIHYTFQIYDPNNPSVRIFFNMKTEGYFATKADRDFYVSWYPTSELAKMPAVEPNTTEAFYKVFCEAMAPNNTANFKFMQLNNFTKVASLGTDALGAETIRATFTEGSGKKMEGIFYCAIMPVWLYYITLLNVYQAVYMVAPENELNNWIPVFDHTLGSIRFTDTFIRNYNDEEAFQGRAAAQIGQICSQMTDIVISGWEARESAYDRISQKQSDATLGYERVYDVETNEIYEAPLDFFDYYKGDRYKTVTDDMYLLPIDGYIDWK